MLNSISSCLRTAIVALYIGFWSGSEKSFRAETSQFFSTPASRINPIKKTNFSVNFFPHFSSCCSYSATLQIFALDNFINDIKRYKRFKIKSTHGVVTLEPLTGPGRSLKTL